VELPGTTCPFAMVDKRHTVSLYDTFDVWPLIELTHSCTALTVGRCGACYNCLERAWALDALGVTDPGAK
jgi:7-cyano-7-deazaguanine synthase in queuosine biosynthesis